MKRVLLILSVMTMGFCGVSQTTRTVSMGAGYANDNYYKLSDENEVSVARSNWDLAFACDGIGLRYSAIRINGGMGVELYKFNDDISTWASVDTTGFDWTTTQLRNSDSSWTIGAFDNTTLVSDSDLGWGTYSFITHVVSGDRIFIIKLADGSFRKLIIEALVSGVYTFKYAKLDGSEEVSTIFTKSDYSGKNFGYYSIQNNQEVDREPTTSSWDLVFTKYARGSDGYVVSGVLTNENLKVVQLDGVQNINAVTSSGETFKSNIGEIGYDWKSFNMQSFQYELDEARVYFVETLDQDIYKIVFTGFGGSSTGDFVFTSELESTTTGIDEVGVEVLSIYPNPAIDVVNLTFYNRGEETTIALYDATGTQVSPTIVNSNSGLSQEFIDVSNLTSGLYFMSFTSSSNNTTEKLIIK